MTRILKLRQGGHPCGQRHGSPIFSQLQGWRREEGMIEIYVILGLVVVIGGSLFFVMDYRWRKIRKPSTEIRPPRPYGR